MEYQFPLTAIHRNGNTRVFEDAESFRAFAHDRSNGKVGGYWFETREHWNGNRALLRLYSESSLRWNIGVKNDWIVRDNCGRAVNLDDFPVVYPDWRASYYKAARRAKELGLPIPGTRKRRWHRKSSTHHGRNGAHNQRKGIKLYEDPKIKNGDFDDL